MLYINCFKCVYSYRLTGNGVSVLCARISCTILCRATVHAASGFCSILTCISVELEVSSYYILILCEVVATSHKNKNKHIFILFNTFLFNTFQTISTF